MPLTSAVQWPEDTMKDKTQLTVTTGMSIKLNTITEFKMEQFTGSVKS